MGVGRLEVELDLAGRLAGAAPHLRDPVFEPLRHVNANPVRRPGDRVADGFS